MRWVLYGATGYTGELIAREALRRGHRPVLAGRSREKLEALAAKLGGGVETAAVALDDAAGLRKLVEGAAVVLHAAGPFARTSLPMLEACLDARAHYLDITGELTVFEQTFAHDARAKERGVALVSGVGLDVVPSDCLAVYVAEKAGGARELEIALAAISQPSAGTVKSAIGVVRGGVQAVRGGELVPLTPGRGLKRVRFSTRERWVMPLPLGDLITAPRSTGIQNVTTYAAISSRHANALRWGWPLAAAGVSVARLALRSRRALALAEGVAEKRAHGPDAELLARGLSLVWARAGEVEAQLELIEGYAFTARSSVLAVEEVAARKPAGALSPAQALGGADFVLRVEGTRRFDVVP